MQKTLALMNHVMCFLTAKSEHAMAGLQTEYHANVSLRLRRSKHVFLQLQFEAFSMPNGRLFQLEIVAGKKEYLYQAI